MALLPLAAILPLLAAAAVQPAEAPDASAPPWTGQMQCSVTWTDPADAERQWMFAVASDSSNLKLALSDRARAGDPLPLAKDETRDLAPRKAKLEISGLGSGEVDITSLPLGDGRMWHDIPLGHAEKLDELPARFTLVLTIGDAAPRSIEMRDFAAARAYLQRCLIR